jgi:hypothetical protein
MAGPVIYIDVSEIREGRMGEVEEGITRLAGLLEGEEPRLISYAAFIDRGEERMTVVHVHVDADSLAWHTEVGGPLFREFTALLRLRNIGRCRRRSAPASRRGRPRPARAPRRAAAVGARPRRPS